jgi:hypothetical protein
LEDFSGRREGVFDLLFGLGLFDGAVFRATGAARFCASFINYGLDGAGAASAFGAAAETAVNFLGASRKARRSGHGIADIMVTQDVAGTNDHEAGRPFG